MPSGVRLMADPPEVQPRCSCQRNGWSAEAVRNLFYPTGSTGGDAPRHAASKDAPRNRPQIVAAP